MTDTIPAPETQEQTPRIDDDAASAQTDETAIEKNPKEAIEELLKEVQGLKPVFLGTIEFCREPKRGAEVDARYDELTEFNRCTFSPVRVRALLEEAGALSYIEPESPEEPCEEDPEYLQITHRPEGWWVATEAGIDAVESLDFLQDTLGMFEEHDDLRTELIAVLRFLADSPLSLSDLDEKMNGKNLFDRTGKGVAYLVKHLESCGAIDFRGKWTITETGKQALAQITNN